MRKLKLQIQISIDGFISGINGEMDWMIWNWDDELKKYVYEITDNVDTIILGRKLAEGFISHWAAVAANPDNPEFEAGKKFTNTQKVVFTNTLYKSEWDNTVLAKGDLVEEITKLKKQDGQDIIAYGGAAFVSNLIREDLIDEYHLFINPALLGNGKSIFNGLDSKKGLTLVKSTSFECGIVVNCYKQL